ncbi:MAG: hypothetical protein WAN72_19415 [Candidatus Acidiferrales bacterium]
MKFWAAASAWAASRRTSFEVGRPPHLPFLDGYLPRLLVAAGAALLDSAPRQAASGSGSAADHLALHTAPSLPLDLEMSGDLIGPPSGSARYVTCDELLGLHK